jgi:hypothetical protein
MVTEAPAPAPALYNAPPRSGALRGAGRSSSVDRGPYPLSSHDPCGSASGFHCRRRSSPSQGQPRGWRLHPWWSLRPKCWSSVVVILQHLERDHLHVAGSGTECLPSSSAGSPDSASLRRASGASLRRASDAPLRRATDVASSAKSPAPGDPHLNSLVPVGWRMGPRLPRRCLQHYGDGPTLL